MITGFNLGQISHYMHMHNGNIVGLPSGVLQEIINNTPYRLLQHHRQSGTMSNYMNLHERGYGEHDHTISDWTQLYSKHNNIFKQLAFTFNVLRKNRAWIFKQFEYISPRSYLYDAVEMYRQTGGRTMAFTFNSHMPHIGYCSLEQSLASLKYIADNTHLISVELENESYFADHITGSNNAKDYIPMIDRYIQYLEAKVVPAVVTVVGKAMPLGISICDNRISKFKYWNSQVAELYRRLTAKGYNVFLVPHLYTQGYGAVSIMEEFIYQTEGVDVHLPMRVTEYNADSEVGNCNQTEALEYIDRVNEMLSQYNVQATYYHSLYTVRGAHFSYVK